MYDDDSDMVFFFSLWVVFCLTAPFSCKLFLEWYAGEGMDNRVYWQIQTRLTSCSSTSRTSGEVPAFLSSEVVGHPVVGLCSNHCCRVVPSTSTTDKNASPISSLTKPMLIMFSDNNGIVHQEFVPSG